MCRCPICGAFRITGNASHLLKGDTALALKLASWTYHQNAVGIHPLINQDTVTRLRVAEPPSAKERAEFYLGAVIKRLAGKLKGRVSLADKMISIASWSFADGDSVALAEYLADRGALDRAENGQEMLLTAAGHMLYDELTTGRRSGSQGFVAMWFDKSMTDAFENGFALAIEGAGYQPFRVDRKDHDQKIDDLIVAELRRSAFVVADFTGHRGGVYYEAGFAHGLNRHVFFSCREDQIKELHFDVRQYNTIPWNVPADIVLPLRNRILAVLGAGPLKPDAKPIPS